MLYVPPISVAGMVMSPDSVVAIVVAGYGLLSGSLLWLWRLSSKHTKFMLEHEALKEQAAKNAASILIVDEASKTRDMAVQTAIDEVKSMMREERHQMVRMASKIDLLISVLVNRTDSTVNLEQIMAILEKGDKS